MQGTFGEIISASFDRTKTILFRPFHFKKWFFLYIIIILSAEFSGCNLNLNMPVNGVKEKIQAKYGTTSEPQKICSIEDGNKNCASTPAKTTKEFFSEIKPFIIPLIAVFVIFGVIFVLLYMWALSRFSFVFINAIAKNDASIKIPFREYKTSGNSYFGWNLLLLFMFGIAGLLIVGVFIGGIFLFHKAHILIKIFLVLFWLAVAVLVFIVFTIIGFVSRDLIVPIMYKEKIGVKSAWQRIKPVLAAEKGNVIVFFLLKIALSIGFVIGALLLMFIVLLLLAIPIGIAGYLLFLLVKTMPLVLKTILAVIFIILGILLLVMMFIAVNLMLIPIPIFLKTFSLKFLGALGKDFDVFLSSEK